MMKIIEKCYLQNQILGQNEIPQSHILKSERIHILLEKRTNLLYRPNIVVNLTS